MREARLSGTVTGDSSTPSDFLNPMLVELTVSAMTAARGVEHARIFTYFSCYDEEPVLEVTAGMESPPVRSDVASKILVGRAGKWPKRRVNGVGPG